MEKLLLSKEEIFKAIKTYKFENTDKMFNKIIKRATINNLVVEEVKAKLQNGVVNGSMVAEGSRENVANPVFTTSLDQNFHTVSFPLLINGDEYAAWAYAIRTGLETKIEGDYPYTKDKIKAIGLRLGQSYFETYINRLNLALKKITVTEASFKESDIPFEYRVFLIKLTTGLLNNGSVVIGYIETIMIQNKPTQNIIFIQ